MVVDEKAALVATFNLCIKYFTLTRDYGVITDDPCHVAQIVEVFNADWEHDDWDCRRRIGVCCGAIPTRGITWRSSSTPPPNRSTSSIRSTSTR